MELSSHAWLSPVNEGRQSWPTLDPLKDTVHKGGCFRGPGGLQISQSNDSSQQLSHDHKGKHIQSNSQQSGTYQLKQAIKMSLQYK